MFETGMKVVCVDDTCTSIVKKGSVYVVTGNSISVWGNDLIAGSHLTGGAAFSGMYAKRFRPLEERKTDISIFEEILRRESMPDGCAPAAVYGVDWGASA